MNNIYVVYEENKNWLAAENAGIDELNVFGLDKRDTVINWINERLKVASDNDYVICEKIDLESELLKEDIRIPLYRSYQDNWDYSFDIVALRMPIN